MNLRLLAAFALLGASVGPLLPPSGREASGSEAACGPDRPQAAARLADLSHAVTSGIPLFPGALPFARTPVATFEEAGYASYHIEMGEHAGTHVDAPLHFVPAGDPVDALDPRRLYAPAVVVDVSSKVPASGDYVVSRADLDTWEKAHGPVPCGALVILRTGWESRWKEPGRYLNLDARKIPRFPGLGEDAARRIVARGAVGVGIDTLSLDPGSSTGFPAHRVLLGAGLYGIENLAGLSALPPTGATVLIAPLKLAGGTGAPARVLALLPPAPPGTDLP
jgi:kynurenine formamidase